MTRLSWPGLLGRIQEGILRTVTSPISGLSSLVVVVVVVGVVVETRVQVIVDELPEDQRRVNQIPRDIDEARKDVREAHTQVTVCSSNL